MKTRLAIFTLGCRVNQFESLAIGDSARENGFDVVDWSESAEIGIVNSCALTSLAEKKTRRAINDFMRANRAAAVAVTGCFAQTDAERVSKIRGVKWVVPNSAKMRIVSLILKNPAAIRPSIFTDENSFVPETVSGAGPLEDRINLKIQDGCDNACSYCIIPRARGMPRSRPFEAIVEDAQNFVSRGVAEIIITGINISKYESERGGLVGLIDALNEMRGLKRIRIGSIEPPHFPFDALLERMADDSHKLCPHMHISAQSLNDVVLQTMRRKYMSKDFLEIVERALSVCPDIAIGADIICGHPQEGDAEFADTLLKASKSSMAYIHAFTFSPRPKTLAAILPNTPPKEIRAERAKQMREVSAQLRANFFAKQCGKIRPLLLENMIADGIYLAHTDNYIQCSVKVGKLGMKNCIVKAKLGKPLGKDRLEAEIV